MPPEIPDGEGNFRHVINPSSPNSLLHLRTREEEGVQEEGIGVEGVMEGRLDGGGVRDGGTNGGASKEEGRNEGEGNGRNEW